MQIKGTALHSTLLAVERLHGAQALLRVRAELPDDIRAQIEPVVLATQSYPIVVNAALHDAIFRVLGHGDGSVNQAIGCEAATIDFGGIYSIFLRTADYETTLRRFDRAWRRYNSQGTVSWTELVDGRARCMIAEVSGYTELMWRAVAGRLQGVLLLAGARRAEVDIMSHADEMAALLLQWEA